MKIKLHPKKVVVLALGLLLAFPVAAQTLTKEFRQVTLTQVLTEVEASMGYQFLFENDEINADKLITVSFENADIKTIMEKILDKGLRYSVTGKLMTISKQTSIPPPIANRERIVRGTVISATDNLTIAGVHVFVEGTQEQTLTDSEGNYTVNLPVGAQEVVYRMLGFQEQRIQVRDIQLMKLVSMNEEVSKIEDVVVVGFGTQKKESVVGAVQSVRPSSLDFPSSNLTASFAGKIAGVISTQRSGEPGADGASFWIRGISTFGTNTSPLIVMDGVEINTTMLNSIAPETIESFSILKDATATALYGSRGANGVMIITTKSGSDMERMNINVRVENGWSMPTSVQKIADGVAFMEAYNDAAGTDYYSQDKIEGTRENRNPYIYPNNDWHKLLFKDFTMNQNVNANITGGGSRVDYFLNATFFNENGIMNSPEASRFNTNINYKKYLFQSNISARVTPTTRLSVRMNTQLHFRHAPTEDITRLFYLTMRANPVAFPAVWPGEEGDTFMRFGNAPSPNGAEVDVNPYALMSRGFGERHYQYYTETINLEQDLKFITPGLKFKAQASFYNYVYAATYKNTVPHYYRLDNYSQDSSTGDYSYMTSPIGPTGVNYYAITTGRDGYRENSLQSSVEYSRKFNDAHDVNALLVYHQKERVNNIADDANIDDEIELLPFREQGLAGRVTYSYKNRYMMEANFGYNGSENFAKGKRFGFFPSVAIGYNISNEPWFEPFRRSISLLKLRFSYGQSGNDALAMRFPFLTEIGINQGMYWYVGPELSGLRGTTISTLGNPDATWEVSTKANLGLELGLFNDLTLIVDLFRENRTGIFMQRLSVPATSGYTGTLPWGNIGAVNNHGVDMSLEYNKAVNQDLIISARASFTYAHNEVTERDEAPGIPPYQSTMGHPINHIMGYVADGLFADQNDIDNSPLPDFTEVLPGDIKYRDLNGDGKINGNDVTILGMPTNPEMVYGFGVSVRWKQFDASIFFQGQAGVSLLMENMHPFNDSGTQGFGMTQWIADNYWSTTNPNPDATYPRLSTAWDLNNTVTSSFWVHNGSFLRLKSMELGYTIKSFRVYATGSNLLTFTKFKYWDPELGTGNGLSYPLQRTFNLGVQYNF